MFSRKILITGLYGLIGSALYETLRKKGDAYDIYGLDITRKLSERAPQNRIVDIRDEKFFLCDLQDRAGLDVAVKGIHTVVHLAADPEGRGWESLLHNNLIGAYNVFEACRNAGVRRIVFASTYLVTQGVLEEEPYNAIVQRRYEDVPEKFPLITPQTPPRPKILYAATKLWGESLARVYEAAGMSCLCIRIGGVRQDPAGRPDVWCSPRDIARMIECCINAPEHITFDVFYARSKSRWGWLDIEHARKTIGYEPLDSGDDFEN